MKSKVSIIVPTYKRGKKFLTRCINSLLNQTYDDIEIILVDDNSGEDLKKYRDTVQKIIKSYGKNKIKYICNEKNLGGSLSRNKGVKFSTGDYVTFLDDDDKYLENKVEDQIKFMKKNNFDMSFTNLKIHNSRNKLVDYREYSDIEKFDNEYLKEYHLKKHITGTPTFMYQKDKFLKIGGFPDVEMGQEYYLMYNTLESNINVGYLASANVIAYRHNDGGISMGENKIRGENKLYNFKKKQFNNLDYRTKLYIRFRHYVVLSVAYKRNKNYFKAIIFILIALILSPVDAIKETLNYFKKYLQELNN
jgi:glycosyltransferase involved in cell wall biosynthesis